MGSSDPRPAPLKVLVATSNQGKLREFRRLSAGTGVELDSISRFSELPVFEENAATFAENSAGKALHYSAYTDQLVIADDSGLAVHALGGAPGVHSARYAGPNASARDRINKLLDEVRSFSGDDRAARFVCVLTLARAGQALVVFSATVEGFIAQQPQGSEGFGYDPVFVPQDPVSGLPAGKTFGELSDKEKDELSHRARAFRKLLDFLARRQSNPAI